MKITRIRIKNFRSFEDETFLINNYCCLIGANGAGKSTVLCALNVFFRESSNPTAVDFLAAEDFHQRRIDQRIQIEVTFGDLGPVAEDALKHYVRGGELTISSIAEFDHDKGRAPVRQVGSRLGMAEFAPFFDAYKAGEPAGVLTEIFDRLRQAFPEIAPARSKEARREALQAFEADPANAHALSLIESEDQFYGIAGQSKLKPFVQWVYIPAVKDARDEQAESKDGAFGKLLARTVRSRVNFRERLGEIERAAQVRYSEMLAEHQAVVDEVGASLSSRLAQWSHPEATVSVEWAASSIAIKEPAARVVASERGFEGEISRFGHGFQRSYLLALLQEMSAPVGDAEPTLVLGVEEPELYQHPPQARHLSETLQSLCSTGSQVLVTTHSAYFVTGANFEQIRLVRRAGAASRCMSLTFDEFSSRYAAAHGSLPRRASAVEAQLNEVLRAAQNEMFFAGKLVLVEGPEDLAYLMSWATLSGQLSAFRRQGVVAVPVGGKENIAMPLIIAQALKIPVYVIFDGDKSHSHLGSQQTHNRVIRSLLGMAGEDLFPDSTQWGPNCVQWAENIGDLVTGELSQTVPEGAYEAIRQRAMAECGHAPSLKKNTRFVESLLRLAVESGARSDSLHRATEEIFAL